MKIENLNTVSRKLLLRLALRFKLSPYYSFLNPLNPELNPIFHFLALLGAHHILHVSRVRVKKFRNLLISLTVKGVFNCSQKQQA